jgi:RimJ/RimL family protein N-acetyltransferase
MGIEHSLFEGKLICLAPIDYEKDPEVESRWTHDPEYLRMLDTRPAIPLSAAKVKKNYEAIEKEMDETRNVFHFTVRTRPVEAGDGGESENNSRLVGFARIYGIEWAHGTGVVKLGIGDAADRGKGYGTEALRLLLRFAFSEINLYRLSALISQDNAVALHVFREAGFMEEVRRRKALYRDGHRFDLIHVGILREEWEEGFRSEE